MIVRPALVLLIGSVLASAPADAGRVGWAAYNVPSEPKMCEAPVPGRRGISVRGTDYPDALCGTRAGDSFVAVGGNDHVWGYQGADDFGVRNGKPDEVYGGPGADRGRFDPCDRVFDVERPAFGSGCPGVRKRSLHAVAPGAPFSRPVVECYRTQDGRRFLSILAEPQMRALDTTARVDFQTVAWSAVILSFENGEWYKTTDAPARDEVAIARAHYGPDETTEQDACSFAQ